MIDSRKYQEQNPEACISELLALPFTNYKYIAFRLLWHAATAFVFIAIKKTENKKARATSFFLHRMCSPYLCQTDEDYMKH